MMGEASLETLPKNNMIQDMINSDNVNSTESPILNIFKVVSLKILMAMYKYEKDTYLLGK